MKIFIFVLAALATTALAEVTAQAAPATTEPSATPAPPAASVTSEVQPAPAASAASVATASATSEAQAAPAAQAAPPAPAAPATSDAPAAPAASAPAPVTPAATAATEPPKTTTCSFDTEKMQLCVLSTNKLAKVTDIEKYFMSDPTIDNFNASCSSAKNMNETTKALLDECQNTCLKFNDGADNCNYMMVDKVQEYTDNNITFDDTFLNELKWMSDNGYLNLVNCNVVERVDGVTTGYLMAIEEAYKAMKARLVPNMPQIISEIEALTADLLVDADSCAQRIINLTEAIKTATKGLSLYEEMKSQFEHELEALATAAQGQFVAMGAEVKALAPKPMDMSAVPIEPEYIRGPTYVPSTTSFADDLAY